MWTPFKRKITYKRIKTLLFLCLLVIVWSFFYGGAKFTLKNLALPNFDISHDKLLAQVEIFLSIGGLSAYAVGGLLSKRFSKRALLWSITIITIITFLIYGLFLTSYWIGFIFAGLSIGFLWSFFAVLRGILISIEIRKTHFSDTFVNGIVTLIYISTFIIGAMVSTKLFEILQEHTMYVITGVLAIGLIIEKELDYSHEDHLQKNMKKNLKCLMKDFKYLCHHRFLILVASGLIWSIYVASGVKMIPYAQNAFDVSEATSSVILLALASGAVLGNLITLNTKNRWGSFLIYLLFFASTMMLSAFFIVSFKFLVLLCLLIGAGMGSTSNLTDSFYLNFIGKHNKQEAGVAYMGIVLNLMLAIILIFGNYVNIQVWFTSMSLILLGLGAVVYTKNRV